MGVRDIAERAGFKTVYVGEEVEIEEITKKARVNIFYIGELDLILNTRTLKSDSRTREIT